MKACSRPLAKHFRETWSEFDRRVRLLNTTTESGPAVFVTNFGRRQAYESSLADLDDEEEEQAAPAPAAKAPAKAAPKKIARVAGGKARSA
jgi:hypothetical protein